MRGWVRGVATAVAAAALAGCWPTVGQGPHRQGYNPYERTLTIDNVTTLTPAWEVDTGGTYPGPHSLVAADGLVVTATGPFVRAFELASGAVRWSVGPAYRNIPWGAPVLDGGVAYLPHTLVGTSTGAYDLQSGQRLDGQGSDGRIVAFSGTRKLVDNAVPDPSFTSGTFTFRVDDEAGSWGGVTHVQAPIIGLAEEVHVSLGTERVFASGYGLLTMTPGDGTSGVGVRAFGPEQPATCGPAENPIYVCPLWVTPLDGTQATPTVLGPGETAVYVATDAGTVYAVDALTGTILWSAALGAPVVDPPALAEGWLYVPLSTGGVAVLAADGCGMAACSPVWTALTGPVPGQPAIAGGVVYVGTGTGTEAAGSLLAFDAAGCGEATCAPVWSADLGSRVMDSPIVTNGQVIVGTLDGMLRSYRPTPPPAASGP